jgi:hypothetical protein
MPNPSLGSQASARSVQDFQGDYGGVARLIQESWSDNNQQPLLYTPEFLSSCFAYPGASFGLAPTLYDGSEPQAFVAGFPRRVRYLGKELQILLVTLLTVAKEHKKSGYGVILWSELVSRARAQGFDGMVNYCVEGEAMNTMIMGCCRMLKLPTERIFSIPYHLRLPLTKGSAAETPQDDKNLSRAMLESAAMLPGGIPLSRVWSRKEVEWQCNRHGAVVAYHVSGHHEGVLTGSIMEIANAQRTKCVLLEDLLWGTLDKQERVTLLEHFLDKAVHAGAQMALAPGLGYADLEPLKAGRFRSSTRILHCYLTIFTGQPMPAPVSSMYLDVL